MEQLSSHLAPELSAVLPCQNEEKTLGKCIQAIQDVVRKSNIRAEIIVSDSSTDNSPNIATRCGAILVKHNKDGYGNAYLDGFQVAKGKYIFCADSDGTYSFSEIPRFLAVLKEGSDLVIGNRFAGNIQNGAMPILHQYVGNPFLSYLMRLFFGLKIHDAHCGMRAIRKSALDQLNLHTTGMEFASEMIIKAARAHLVITELPIDYAVRAGQSKLRPFGDGWRHFRFMLLYSPLFLFFLPGVVLTGVGVVSLKLLYFDQVTIGGLHLYYHPMFLSALLIILGYQLIIFALFAKTYAITNLGEHNETIAILHKYLTIETAGLIGIILGLAGLSIYVWVFTSWLNSGFGEITQVKNMILALTLSVVGFQTLFSSFMLSILGIRQKP